MGKGSQQRNKSTAYRPRAESRLRTALRRREVRIPALVLGVPVACIVLWVSRILWRPLFMLFVIRYPALLSLPVLSALTGVGVHLLGRLLSERAEPVTKHVRDERRSLVRTGLIAAAVALAFAAIMTNYWTKAALYEHTRYSTLDLQDLDNGQVRIKPYAVAIQQTQNGLNSPTEHPSNMHIVKVDGRIAWTSVRDPEGLVRVLTKPTRGVMSVDAGSSTPRAQIAGPRYDATFKYGPGMQISENIRWQLYKRRCFTCDIAEIVGVPTAGGPVLVAPYLRYEGGLFVRRPVFGGVYIVHPDGEIADLSPREAARNPLLRGTGRIFPEKLARMIADAYSFKKGVLNRLFTHEQELHVADTEQNRQPFLEDFGRIGTQWLTTMKPRGDTYTTAAIMATDAVTGRTRIWHVPPGRSLIGNERALDIVRGQQYPGIVFAPADAKFLSGRFRVVEPRQVFRDGRLYFLCSIIPDGASRVTLSVLVDAETQQVAKSFQSTPAGDASLVEFLHGQRETNAEPKRPAPDAAPPVSGGDADVLQTLQRLLRQNRAEQRDNPARAKELQAQERDLQRLVRAAQQAR